MSRKSLACTGQREALAVGHFEDADALNKWILDNAQDGDYLLAHALDGVIWGRVDAGKALITSHMLEPRISPALHPHTLQELRLFRAERTVHLWRTGTGWQALTASETDSAAENVLHERQVLWGTSGAKLQHGFTLLTDGAQGLRHAVPIDASAVNEKDTRACLTVHHHLERDPQTAVTRIAYSRVAKLEVVTYDGQ